MAPKVATISPVQEVFAFMEGVPSGRRLGDLLTPCGEGAQLRLEGGVVWVKAPEEFLAGERLGVRATAPQEQAGWILLHGSVDATTCALLQSRLLSWYVRERSWGDEQVGFRDRLARVPWPTIPLDLKDQLNMLMFHRQAVSKQAGSTRRVDESIERVVVELYGLGVHHLMTLDGLEEDQRRGPDV